MKDSLGADASKEDLRYCNAQLRGKPGHYCKKFPVSGSNRCRLHGGLTPRGAALPQYKTGQYSKSLPDRYAARFEEFLSDTELLTLNREIALLRSRLTEQLEQLDQAVDLERAITLVEQLDQDDPKVQELRSLFNSARSQQYSWRDVQVTIDSMRKVSESERTRVKEATYLMRVDESLALFTAVVNAVKANVSSKQEQVAIAKALQPLMDRQLKQAE